MRYSIVLASLCLLAACDNHSAATSSHEAPATAQPVAHETELLRLTLPDQTEQRLGIATASAVALTWTSRREVGGEIVVPPLVKAGVPTGSVVNFQQLAAQQVAADAQVAAAQAQAQLAAIALQRADALIKEQAGSQRAHDEAAAALATAQAALQAARQQRELLGPAVDAYNRQSELWVRAAVFSGDLGQTRSDASAQIRTLDGRMPPLLASRVQAPPSANAMAATVDLYFALPATAAGQFQVGQRVAVSIALGEDRVGLGVPREAIVRDIYGGEWVYRKTATNTYVRQRVEVAAEREGIALLARGLAAGDEIVTAGAAELFGVEFGAAH
ncbi:MAG: efflux RND transporter periplasmic adaptor subunit [Gammaproteobacteria bacterium]|nr:efflux RND transporter periplasmic adaptor subunit [Gammaproteobacteria bacterium]